MATTETQIEPGIREPLTGYVKKRYKIVLDSTTDFTLADGSWADVVEMSAFEAAATAGTGEVYWDGSDIKGASFTSGGTVYLTVVGVIS